MREIQVAGNKIAKAILKNKEQGRKNIMRKEKRIMTLLLGIVMILATLFPQMPVSEVKAAKTTRKYFSLVAGETVTKSVSRTIKSVKSKKRTVATVSKVSSNQYQITAKNAGYATIVVKYGKKRLNIVVSVSNASTVFDGGNGTKQSPYQISTLDQLKKISEYSSCYFKQVADIDAEYSTFDPLFSEQKPFTGEYDGGQYSITNYSNTDPEGWVISIFGWIGESGTVKNVTIDNSYLTIGSGAVLAYKNEGNILDCNVTNATITLKDDAGAFLCSKNTGKIKRCVVDGTMKYNQNGYYSDIGSDIGCVVGYNEGEIYNCMSKSDIIVDRRRTIHVGGIVGYNKGMIMECQSDSTIEADGGYNGKIVGYNEGNVVRCHSGEEDVVGGGNGQVIEK